MPGLCIHDVNVTSAATSSPATIAAPKPLITARTVSISISNVTLRVLKVKVLS
jgi:hypothetical protein